MRAVFGSPDGANHSISDGFVFLSPRYGAIGQEISQFARARVVVGGQGVGKTLFLRRLNDYYSRNDSVITSPPVLMSDELDTETVIRFSQMFTKATATEAWSIVWRRAIELTAATLMTSNRRVRIDMNPEIRSALQSSLDELQLDGNLQYSITRLAAHLVRRITARRKFQEFCAAQEWDRFSNALGYALKDSPPVFILIDAIDDNFRFAVSHWTMCQRGLFFAVMNLERAETRTRLHPVITLRDLIFNPLARGEHAMRYTMNPSIVSLQWTRDSARDFFAEKVARLPASLFRPDGERSAEALLGRNSIRSSSRDVDEEVTEFLLRHTRHAPREIVVLGNELISQAERQQCEVRSLTDGDIEKIAVGVARASARSALALVANQIASDALPWTSARREYVEDYTFGDAGFDGLVQELSSIILSARKERIDREDVVALDREAERRFGKGSQLSDVLWRSQLLGHVNGNDSSTDVFHVDGGTEDGTELPMAQEYVFNSILCSYVDIAPDARPHSPRGES